MTRRRDPQGLRDALCEAAQRLTGTEHELDEPALDLAVCLICGMQDEINRMEDGLTRLLCERNNLRAEVERLQKTPRGGTDKP